MLWTIIFIVAGLSLILGGLLLLGWFRTGVFPLPIVSQQRTTTHGFSADQAARLTTLLIINPNSGGGKQSQKLYQTLQAVEEYFPGDYSVCLAQTPDEATQSASKAAQANCQLIIVAGGDGTIQSVLNGLFRNGHLINPVCQLGILAKGTGNGFSLSLGLSGSIREEKRGLSNGKTRSVDVGRLSFHDGSGKVLERFFINECQVGIGATVVRRVETRKKRLGGLMAFGWETFRIGLGHPAQMMTVRVDDAPAFTQALMGIVIANGALTGGGMKLAPRALLDDGLFDILLIHNQPLWKRLVNFPKIYSGRHIDSPDFSYFQGKRIAISSSEKTQLEADGELLGFLPCIIEILPSVLKINSIQYRKNVHETS